MTSELSIGRRRRAAFVALAALVLGFAAPALALQDAPADAPAADAAPAPAENAAPAPAAADAAPAGEATTDSAAEESESFLGMLVRANGWLFGPIFLCMSFVLVALILINTMQIRRENLLPTGFVEDFEQKLAGKDYQAAYETARNDDSFVARVLAAGLAKLSRGYPEAVEGMQEVGEEENMVLEHRLSYLALIGSIAPMVGLLGTVWGMVAAFQTIARSTTQPKPAELADGIATALVTTLEGLIIAIPAMIAYSLLRNRAARYVLEVGMVSDGLMQRFSSVGKGKPMAGGAAPAAAPAKDA
ncbi:MAG: MotA/TolQ/ExbB proton channel family protein [Planctomycetaceae bacterium]|nr:MotA/TolQ/ExbB proton channel family protein [Planctomycetaceae bacterium]